MNTWRCRVEDRMYLRVRQAADGGGQGAHERGGGERVERQLVRGGRRPHQRAHVAAHLRPTRLADALNTDTQYILLFFF